MPDVLITGTSSGLGLEFVRSMAAEGWRIIATCRNPSDALALKGVGGDIRIRPMDVSRTEQIRAVAGEFSGVPLDMVINNAGTHGPRDASGTFGDIDVEAWIEVLRVNAIGPAKVAEAFLPNIRLGRMKKLVFVTSRAGSISERGSLPHMRRGGPYIYRTSKAAANAAAKAIAYDLQPEGISVVVLHPGWVKTETGGWDAPGDPAISVAGMRKVIDSASPADNGIFRNVDGAPIPW
ncbi:MAG: SDR family oxidoreductase [Verrucomicrobia bacterium]|nr:SDR family oxidoreductase [Verrucomicrobiota bacterium]